MREKGNDDSDGFDNVYVAHTDADGKKREVHVDRVSNRSAGIRKIEIAYVEY